MAKLPEYYNIGDPSEMTVEKLLIIVQNIYKDLAIEVNKKPDIIERVTDGQAGDTFLSNGSININTTTTKVEVLVAHPTASTVTWKEI